MLSLTRTHSLCETEGIEFNAVIIPTDVDRSLKFLQIKQKAAGNPAAFCCFWVYKVDRFHSESVNLSCVGWPDLLVQIYITFALSWKAVLVIFFNLRNFILHLICLIFSLFVQFRLCCGCLLVSMSYFQILELRFESRQHLRIGSQKKL